MAVQRIVGGVEVEEDLPGQRLPSVIPFFALIRRTGHGGQICGEGSAPDRWARLGIRNEKLLAQRQCALLGLARGRPGGDALAAGEDWQK